MAGQPDRQHGVVIGLGEIYEKLIALGVKVDVLLARRGRAVALTPERRSGIPRAGAAAINTPAAPARRIVKAWPGLSHAERAEIREILAAILPPRARGPL